MSHSVEPPHSIQTIPSATAALCHRVSRLEDAMKLKYNFPEVLEEVSRKTFCPADNCNRSYFEKDRLHNHIRTSPGSGHKFLISIIDQKYCLHCDEIFTGSKGLFLLDYRGQGAVIR